MQEKGAYLTHLISTSGKSLHECLCLYFRMKDITFVGKRPYANEPLENLLKDCLGPNTVMADISHPK